jgi:hypothetical protein
MTAFATFFGSSHLLSACAATKNIEDSSAAGEDHGAGLRNL